MFTPILEVCTSFQATWDAFVDEWNDGEDGLPQYLALSDLARHLIEMLERKEIDGVKSVFGVGEQWHLEGDPYVKEAGTVGLLEDLQNTNLHKGTACPYDFLGYLLPETRFWWFKVVDFWDKGILISDDRSKH